MNQTDARRERDAGDREAIVEMSHAENRRTMGMAVIFSVLIAFGIGTYTFMSWQETQMMYLYRSQGWFLLNNIFNL